MPKMQTMYDNMEFKKREFMEYPKAIPFVDGKVQDSAYDKRGKPYPIVVVNSHAEEEALRGENTDIVPVSTGVSRVEGEDDVRKALYIRADQSGALIDKRWSIERITKTIVEKEAANRAAAKTQEDPL